MRLFWLAALMMTAPGLLAMEIYRSLDEHGNPVYSDRPFGEDAQPISIIAPRPSPLPSSPASRPQVTSAADADDSEPPLVAEVERDPTAEERARACEVARERLQVYMNARRLYRDLPGGERQYLDSEEIEQARASAAADVETWCA